MAENYQSEMSAPPRLLFWGLIILFVLVIAGGIAGIVVFQYVLQPGQQERVMNMLPFMEAFQIRQPTPQGGVLPTPVQQESTADPLDLLDIQIGDEDTPEVTEPDGSTPTATEAAALATATPTQQPTLTPTPTLTPSPVPTMQASNSTVSNNTLPNSARMFGFAYHKQTWNNCGPATTTIALSYYGWTRDQEYAASYLKPNREDKNVSPDEIAAFVNVQSDLQAIVRNGGDLNMLKALIAANYPVIIETGEMFEAYDWIGHYRTLVAYDDILGVFYAYDSFLGISNGEGVTIPYREQDERWKAFNRVFIVLYPPQDEQKVAAILGPLYDEQSANEHAFAVAQNEARQNPQDAFAWFNMGSSLAALGRYEEAARAYDRARQIGELPWRMLWYQFGVFEAYFNVGRYDDIIALAQANLNNSPELEESYYWQGRALAAQGKTTEAATAFRAALRRNPRYEAARIALDGLPG